MLKFLYEGGPVFTVPLTLLLVLVLALAVRFIVRLRAGKFAEEGAAHRSLDYVRYVGVLAMTLGILGQIVGLYSAFAAIAEWGGIDPGMLASGLRVSSITTLYGISIFVMAYVLWLILKATSSKQLAS